MRALEMESTVMDKKIQKQTAVGKIRKLNKEGNNDNWNYIENKKMWANMLMRRSTASVQFFTQVVLVRLR